MHKRNSHNNTARLILALALIVCLVIPQTSFAAITSQKGDINDDGSMDISDLVYLVDYMFGNGSEPPVMSSADCNDDGQVDIADLICFVDWWFPPW